MTIRSTDDDKWTGPKTDKRNPKCTYLTGLMGPVKQRFIIARWYDFFFLPLTNWASNHSRGRLERFSLIVWIRLTSRVQSTKKLTIFFLPSNHNQIYKRFPITSPKGMVKVSLGCEVAWKRFNKCKINYSVAWNEKYGESENAQQEICRNQLPKSEFSRELKYLLLDISNELP